MSLSVFHSPDVVDLCAGPGGWDEGIRHLGIRPLGIEIDEIASTTATLAGHARVIADMSALNPKTYIGARGLIASPPCQGFSMAGKGDGRKDAELLLATIRDDFAIDPDAAIAKLHDQMHDDRSVLVLEPLRWALALLPEWMAWEQVPTVLPIWEACADVLQELGYSVETGICSSEEYGVPQTRERAILVARSPEMVRRLGPARLAPATHSYYHRRNPRHLDEGVLPWVSMAEALSWGMTERPYFTIAGGTAQGGADAAMLGGSGARASLDREIQAGRWKQRSNYSGPGKPGQSAAERGLGTREAGQPSFAVTSKAFHWVPDDVEFIQGPQANATRRRSDQPAPTITGGHDYGSRRWQFAGAGATARDTAGQVPRDLDLPAHTITGKGTAAWTPEGLEDDAVYRNGNQANAAKRPLDTPAPTLHFAKRANKVEWMPAGLADNPRASGVRVTVQEAAVLQSFPWDYPWQGNKGDQYRQVGDAVPPLMAYAIVKAVTTLDTRS